MRLAHPVALDEARRALYAWIVRGTVPENEPELALMRAFARAKTLGDADLATCVDLIRETNLPREAIPTNWLREPDVWAALLETMPMTAAIRNLATMTRVGLLTPKSDATSTIAARLRDRDRLKAARVHPLALLSAHATYRSGYGARGSGTWTPVAAIVEALDDAFYLAFETIEPSNSRMLIGLDVSGSMASETIAGVPGIAPRVAAAAMLMTHLRAESNVRVMAFSNEFVKLDVSKDDHLEDVVRKTSDLPFNNTDCSLPMLYALAHRKAVDTFVIYTDNETWAGSMHPDEALRRYRKVTGIHAKLVVVGMTSTGFTIADPNDAGMLDVVGFDSAAPALISNFAKQHEANDEQAQS